MTWQDWSDAIANGVRGTSDEVLKLTARTLSIAPLVLTAGNGGSHAIASHAAQALMKPDCKAGGGIATICLSDAVPTLTAHANDGGWVSALEEIARPFLRLAPTLLLFSSSGKSENMVRLARTAKQSGCRVIAFTGFDGQPLQSLATFYVHVSSFEYEVVEPAHDALLHRVQYHLRNP
jgi:D-sedoheptulose 7-phosphate isomerase